MRTLTELSLRWPRITLVVACAISTLSAISAVRAPISAGAYAYIGDGHPAVREFEDFIERFAGGYPLIIAWSCGSPADPCESVFDDSSLLMADRLGNEIARAPGVVRVASPANTPLLVAESGGVTARRFVEGGIVNARKAHVQQALKERLWVNALVSADARAGALIVELPSTDITGQFALIDAVEHALEPEKHAGFQFYLSGGPWIETALYRGTAEGSQIVGAATGFVLACCILLFLRSWQSVVGVLVTIGMGSACAIGVLPLLGWVRNPITMAAPTLVLVVGTADAIHLLTNYWETRRGGADRIAAIRSAAHETQWPCVMTTLTNVAGLVSFVGTQSPAIVQFGVLAGAGVLACLFLTFSVLPAVMILLPDSPGKALREADRWDRILGKIVDFALERPASILATLFALTVVCGTGLARLEVDPSALRAFKPGDPTRTAIEWVGAHLRPLEGIEIELTAPSAITEPRAFSTLQDAEARLAKAAQTGRPLSITALLDSAAHAFVGEAANPANAGDLLALLSLTDSNALEPWLSPDLSRARISIPAPSMNVENRRQLLARVEAALERLPDGWSYLVTGPTVLHLAIDQAIASTARQSIVSSTLLVCVLVMISLRSIRWGALAMIPNIVPLVILFGLMGLLGIPLEGGSVVVAPIAIGIAVDDTIHLLFAYSNYRRTGVDGIVAMRLATKHCGRAVVTTSCALALGFLAMTVSRFQSVAHIGRLSAAAILAAAAVELQVLPALLALASGRRSTPGSAPWTA